MTHTSSDPQYKMLHLVFFGSDFSKCQQNNMSNVSALAHNILFNGTSASEVPKLNDICPKMPLLSKMDQLKSIWGYIEGLNLKHFSIQCNFTNRLSMSYNHEICGQ